jgi:hypothetical protein
MTVSDAAPSLVVVSPENEPLVLAGPPKELSGRIDLHNAGDAKVVLRDAGLTDHSGLLRLPTERHTIETLVLRPDERGSLPLELAIDPTTPPGEYHAELDVGGRSRRVVLQVVEVVDLTVEPRSLVIENRRGAAQRKRLLVRNDGNVPFAVGDPVTVDLREDRPRDRGLRVALEPLVRRTKPDLDELVVALLAVAREEERLGSVEARADAQVEVRPGETAALELELTLIDELPATRRYRGRLPVVTRDVDVIVLVSGPAAEEPPPADEARPTRRRKKSTTATTATEPQPKREAKR